MNQEGRVMMKKNHLTTYPTHPHTRTPRSRGGRGYDGESTQENSLPVERDPGGWTGCTHHTPGCQPVRACHLPVASAHLSHLHHGRGSPRLERGDGREASQPGGGPRLAYHDGQLDRDGSALEEDLPLHDEPPLGVVGVVGQGARLEVDWPVLSISLQGAWLARSAWCPPSCVPVL